MPGPVSRTSTRTRPSASVVRSVSTRGPGCFAIAWCAFWTRLKSTCRIWSWSAYTDGRSEEHTSELQSLAYLVCRLLLEKKKKNKIQATYTRAGMHMISHERNSVD